MPTLIYYDQAANQRAQQEGAEMAGRLTDLVARFAALNLPNAAPVATADLPDLTADPKAWLVGRFLGSGSGTFTLGGLPVYPEKVLELVQRPAGFDEFIAAAQETTVWFARLAYELRSAASYAVAGNGQVNLSATAAAAQEARFKRYTTTAAQDALLTDLTAVCTVLNRLRTGVLSGGNLLSGGGRLDEALIVPMHGSPAPVRPNPDFIINYAR